jgi:GNAT superfamily N-acetyltransferase
VSTIVQPHVAGDDAGIVEIYNRQEGDSLPLTLARLRAERAEQSSGGSVEEWVALEGEQLVGAGRFSGAWWTGQPGIYAVEIRVEPSWWRRGTGTQLYDQLRSRLLCREATRLVSWVRADVTPARGFAVRHGFQETGKIIQEYRLHVPEANTDDLDGGEERLRREGLRIASLAELGREDEPFLRALQAVWADSGDEPPDLERLRDSFSSWRRGVLQGPGLSLETHWVALDGEQPVGMSFLKRLSEDAAENDYTGVASTHRGRGIATALKRRAIAWARERGVRRFFTSSEIGNARMIGINRRLGYKPGVQRLEVARDLTARTGREG